MLVEENRILRLQNKTFSGIATKLCESEAREMRLMGIVKNLIKQHDDMLIIPYLESSKRAQDRRILNAWESAREALNQPAPPIAENPIVDPDMVVNMEPKRKEDWVMISKSQWENQAEVFEMAQRALEIAINTVECDSLDKDGNELPWYVGAKKALAVLQKLRGGKHETEA